MHSPPGRAAPEHDSKQFFSGVGGGSGHLRETGTVRLCLFIKAGRLEG